MLTLPRGIRVFAYAQPTDLRRSFDRLAAMVREHLRHDPLGGDLYLFRNRAGDRVKVFWHEPTGFWIFYHRLHRGTFHFPQARGGSNEIEIEAADLAVLLAGVGSTNAKRR
jgi:transposase